MPILRANLPPIFSGISFSFPQRHRFTQFAAVAVCNPLTHPNCRPSERHRVPIPFHNGTVSRDSLPLRYAILPHTRTAGLLNGIASPSPSTTAPFHAIRCRCGMQSSKMSTPSEGVRISRFSVTPSEGVKCTFSRRPLLQDAYRCFRHLPDFPLLPKEYGFPAFQRPLPKE